MPMTATASEPIEASMEAPTGASIEALERRIAQLEKQVMAGGISAGTMPTLAESVRTLRELFEYAVLRPVDLVKLDGHPYFFYTKDLLYTLFAEHMPDSFVRNYRLTPEDLVPQQSHPFSIAEYVDGLCRQSPRNEHFAKLRIMAHLWLHNVDFTLLDIGANVGHSAVPCAKFIQGFGKANRIHAFEPGIAGELLRANLDLNRVADIVISDFRAVSDRCAPVAMNSMLGHSVCDSINDFRKHYPHLVPALTRMVNTVTVDQFVRDKQIRETLILKIDAEGHDWQVLQGARQSFERGQVGVAMIEFVPHYLKQYIDPTQLLIDLSRDHYLLYILELKQGYHWKGRPLPTDASQLREFTQQVRSSPLTWTDIVAISKRIPESAKLAKLLCDD